VLQHLIAAGRGRERLARQARLARGEEIIGRLLTGCGAAGLNTELLTVTTHILYELSHPARCVFV